MIIYNIQTNGRVSQLIIEVIDDSVMVEPDVVAYTAGNIQLNADISASSRFIARFIGKNFFKPIFSGTGKIYTKPTLGTYHKFILKKDDELKLGSKNFIACRTSISLKPKIRPSLNKFLSGTPMVENTVQGVGNVMIVMPGPVIEYVLKDDKFASYDTEVAAYTSNLEIRSEFAGKGWLNIAHKRIKVFHGNGTVYFTPIPNKDAKI